MYEGKKEDDSEGEGEQSNNILDCCDEDPMLYHHLRLEIVKA